MDPQCIWIYILAEGHPPLEAISNDRLQTQTLYRAKDRGMFTVLCFRRSKLALWNSHLPLVLDMKPFLERFLDLSFTILDIDRLCVNHHSNHSNPFVRFVHPCVERTALNNDGPRLCNGLGCAVLEDEGEFSRDFSRQWGTIQGARADIARQFSLLGQRLRGMCEPGRLTQDDIINRACTMLIFNNQSVN